MAYIPKSDSYLMSLTKKQLIEELRIAEHNFFTMEEALNNSAKAGTDIYENFKEAQKLLKIMFDDITNCGVICACCVHNKQDGKAATCRAGVPCVLQYKYRYEDDIRTLLKDNDEGGV